MEEGLKSRKEEEERDLINNQEITNYDNKSPSFARTSERCEFFDQVTVSSCFQNSFPTGNFLNSKNLNISMEKGSFLTSDEFRRRFHYRSFFLYQVALLLDYIDEAEYYLRRLHGDYDFTFDNLDAYQQFFSSSLEDAKIALSVRREKELYDFEILLAEEFLLTISFDQLKEEVVHKQHTRG